MLASSSPSLKVAGNLENKNEAGTVSSDLEGSDSGSFPNKDGPISTMVESQEENATGNNETAEIPIFIQDLPKQEDIIINTEQKTLSSSSQQPNGEDKTKIEKLGGGGMGQNALESSVDQEGNLVPETKNETDDSDMKEDTSLHISEVVSCKDDNDIHDDIDIDEEVNQTKYSKENIVGDIEMAENQVSDDTMGTDNVMNETSLNDVPNDNTSSNIIDVKSMDEDHEPVDKSEVHYIKDQPEDEPSMSMGSDSAIKPSFKDILKTKLEPVELKEETKSASNSVTIEKTESEPKPCCKGEVKTEEIKEVVSTAERSKENDPVKRRLSEPRDSEDSSTKRPKLDAVVNSTGEHGRIKSESEMPTVIMDSDDDDNNGPSSPLTSNKTVQDDKIDANAPKLKLSGQMLRNLIKASLKSCMTSIKLEKEQQIDDRMLKMEAATDLWRETAKHLEKSVNELTAYTKELRKRKSNSNKLKHLASRSVATQVSLAVTLNNQVSIQTQNRSTNLPPSALRNPTGSCIQRPIISNPACGNIARPNYSTQSPRQQMRQVNARSTTGILSSSQHLARPRAPLIHQNSSPQAHSSSYNSTIKSNVNLNQAAIQQAGRGVSKISHTGTPFPPSPAYQDSTLIDLTAEEDSSRQTKPSLPPSSRTPRASVHQGSTPGRVAPEAHLVPQSNQMVRTAAIGTQDRQNLRLANSSNVNVAVDPVSAQNVVNGNMPAVPPFSRNANSNSRSGNVQAANRGSNSESSPMSQATNGTLHNSSHSLPPSVYVAQPTKHPAPLPKETVVKQADTSKLCPPKPSLKISRVAQGIVLSWNMPPSPGNIAKIASYQLFAYQETSSPPSSSLWKKVGDVKALPLPMACTLVQFQEGNKYYFAVRAIDQYGRWGEYSDPSSIYLFPK